MDLTLLFAIIVSASLGSLVTYILCQRTQKSRAELYSELSEKIVSAKAELRSESESILNQRRKELDQRSEENLGRICGQFETEMRQMKQAFELNKEMQSKSTAQIQENISTAVRDIVHQSEQIGNKADNLASALRGTNKMQGCWGETILGNIFREEGLVEGRDYDSEFTLRDSLGMVVPNEDTGRRMRPDFILHFPDESDIVVDSKVSLAAISDYYATSDPALRQDALKRNLESVESHVRELARKDYTRYLPSGHKFLDYTILFIPNYAAFHYAKELKPDLFADAFRQNILITTEETIMPFLRMIRTAWVNVDQVKNQQQIVSAAQNMIDRVHDFAASYAAVGKKLEDAIKEYQRADSKLRDSGQSIITSAKQVVKLGIPENPSKKLPSD